MWSIISSIAVPIVKGLFGLVEKDQVEEWKSRALVAEKRLEEERNSYEREEKVNDAQDAVKDPESTEDDVTGANAWNSGD